MYLTRQFYLKIGHVANPVNPIEKRSRGVNMNYNQAEDRSLIDGISRHDLESLDALYSRYGGPVYALALRMLRDPGASEEVTQDTFFNVWRRANSYRSDRGSVTGWLFSIAHHRAIDELRKRSRERGRVQYGLDLANRPSESRSDDPSECAALQFEGSCITEALTTLRPEQREVVVLAYFSGLTHSEISQRLGTPLGTVKTRMRLAMKKLREALAPRILERPSTP